MGTLLTQRSGRLTALACLSVAGLWLVLARAGTAQAGGTVGSGTSASCNEAALDEKLVGGGSVSFNCGAGPVTIVVSSTKDIVSDTQIDGGGLVTLSGGGTVRVLKVEAGVTLQLNNLTLSNGFIANDYGGAIRNSGVLIVNNSRVLNSQTTGNGTNSGGGGISSEGTLTVTNSVISGNSSALGGGINSNGPTRIVNSQISGNAAGESGGGVFIFIGGKATISGGAIFSNTTTGLMTGGGAGIYNVDSLSLDHVNILGNITAPNREGGGILNTASGTMTLTSILLSGNSASFYGGGISNYGTATLNASTLSGNRAGYGGGISNYGTATLNASTLSGNMVSSAGGGIYEYGGMVTLNNSTLSGNSSGGGGGIYNYSGGIARLTNSTLSGNMATNAGGGVENISAMTMLTNTTLSGNSALNGGGIYHSGANGSQAVILWNSIVANSPSGENCYRDPASSGGSSINSFGYNLSSDTSCQTYFTQGTDLPPSTDPNLGPLANNGGPTLTHLPLTPDSPGIDVIPHFTNGCGTVVNTDQRGAPRPINLKCDSGAVEYGAILSRLYLPLSKR